MWFINNISKPKMTSLVFFLSLAILISSAPLNKLRKATCSVSWCCPLLGAAETSSTNANYKTFLSLSFHCCFLHSLALKDISRLIQLGSRSLWNFPSFNSPSSSLPVCFPCPQSGEWLTAVSVLDAFLPYRCYTKKTWGPEFQSPSLLRSREPNTIKKTLARYFGEKGKRDVI